MHLYEPLHIFDYQCHSMEYHLINNDLIGFGKWLWLPKNDQGMAREDLQDFFRVRFLDVECSGGVFSAYFH